MFITKTFEEQISHRNWWTNLGHHHLGVPTHPYPDPLSPSHSKWTHNCRSSGETVTNCRESSIYDLSSDQPFGHLFRRKILNILGADLKKSNFKRKILACIGCTTLFYDLTAWTGRILRPLYIIQHRSLWPLYITHTKLLPAFTLGVSQNHLVWFL